MTLKKLSNEEVSARLATTPGWSLRDGKLYRELVFADFVAAFSFMTKVALMAERAAHHPEWFKVYTKVPIHLATHEVDGLSQNDFDLAAEISKAAG
jgi:4a-hydroxytetrahydrobiopterin dehydratase